MSASPMVAGAPSWPSWALHNMVAALGGLARRPRGAIKPIWRAYGRVAAGAVAAGAVLLLIMLFVDVAAIRTALRMPPWLGSFFQFVTRFGLSGWFLVPLGGALLLLGLIAAPSLSRMTRSVIAAVSVRLAFLFLAIAVPGLVVTVVKRLIGRARPLFSGEDAFLYHFFWWRPDYASLPSGHATTAFAALVAFGVLWPRLRPLVWAYAVLIGVSRIAIAAHYPSDVVAGALAGAVGALLVRDWLAARRLGFIICNDGRVVPMPGPSLQRIKRVARNLAGQ